MTRPYAQGKAARYDHRRAGFSLLELSLVLAIAATVAVFGLDMAAQFTAKRAYARTQEKLAVIDRALMDFYQVYNRLPCPAYHMAKWNDANYGQEFCSYPVGSAYAGTVPLQVLNLPQSAGVDAYGSKIRYRVDKEITIPIPNPYPATPRPTPQTQVRTGRLQQPCTTECGILTTEAVYVINSTGPDKRLGFTPSAGYLYGGDLGDQRIDAQTSRGFYQTGSGGNTSPAIVPSEDTVYDSRYNAGSEIRNYFDDLILWRTRAMLYE